MIACVYVPFRLQSLVVTWGQAVDILMHPLVYVFFFICAFQNVTRICMTSIRSGRKYLHKEAGRYGGNENNPSMLAIISIL